MLHQIGAGVLGPVFRTHEPGVDRLVAVKVFRLDITPEQARDLARELDKLAGLDLDHPAIIRPLAGGVEGTVAYLAQEYAAADSIDVEYRQSTPSLPDLIRLAGILASAIDFASFAGAHHGAFHPRDVLVTRGEPRVTGFGVAQALERVGIRVPARRPYSAPERLAGTPWGRAADVFALGAVTYELMFGRRLSGDPAQALDSLSEMAGKDHVDIVSVFASALALDPASRFSTALAFAEAFGESVQAQGKAAARPERERTASGSAVGVPSIPSDATSPVDDLDMNPPPSTHPAGEIDLSQRIFADDGSTDALDLAEHARTQAKTTDSEDAETVELVPDEEAALLQFRGELGLPDEESLDPTVKLTEATETVAGPWGEYQSDETMKTASVISHEPTARPMWPLIATFLAGLGIGSVAGYQLASPASPTEQLVRSTAPPTSTEPPADAPLAATGNGPVRTAGPGGDVTLPSSRPAVPAPPLSRTDAGRPGVSAQPAGGRLLVRSTPAGAQVAVDGRRRGVTPLTLTRLAFGTHRVRLTRAGYESAERRVTVSAAKPASNLQVVMTAVRTQPRDRPSKFAGSLEVISKPPGASVYLDGRLVGQSPLTVQTVGAGSHVVRLELVGYRRWSSSVRVVAGQSERLTASLERGASR